MPKRTESGPRPVTTIRFRHDLMEFLRSAAKTRPDGIAGVVNDAVAMYRDHVEERGKRLRDGIPEVV